MNFQNDISTNLEQWKYEWYNELEISTIFELEGAVWKTELVFTEKI